MTREEKLKKLNEIAKPSNWMAEYEQRKKLREKNREKAKAYFENKKSKV